MARIDWSHQGGGALTHLKFVPANLTGEAAVRNLRGLIEAFFQNGGLGLHCSIADTQTLRDAQQHPEEYSGLLVRVGGYSASFTLLSREFQNNIIERTQHSV